KGPPGDGPVLARGKQTRPGYRNPSAFEEGIAGYSRRLLGRVVVLELLVRRVRAVAVAPRRRAELAAGGRGRRPGRGRVDELAQSRVADQRLAVGVDTGLDVGGVGRQVDLTLVPGAAERDRVGGDARRRGEGGGADQDTER